MEYQDLILEHISAQGLTAQGLKNVYCQVSFPGYPKSKQKMFINDTISPTNMKFVVDEPYLTKPGFVLYIQLKERRSFLPDKEIGSVVVPVEQLYQNKEHIAEYQVRKSGVAKVLLQFSYRFGEKFMVQAYPTYNRYRPRQKGRGDRAMDGIVTCVGSAACCVGWTMMAIIAPI